MLLLVAEESGVEEGAGGEGGVLSGVGCGLLVWSLVWELRVLLLLV